MTEPIRKPKQGVSYQEDPDVLAWIETLRADIEAYRGREVSRGEVLRWLTRRGRQQFGNLSIGTVAGQV